MFDLEKEIREWKKGFNKYESFEDGLVADMELHLRDAFAARLQDGLIAEEAFHKAVEQIGTAEQLAAEYGKNRELALDRRAPWRPARFLPALLWNYCKTARRRIFRHKVYSLINIAGLAAGMTCCLLIILYVTQEAGYDRFHRKAERIYRVILGAKPSEVPTNANGSMAIGPALKRDFPEIVEVVRLKKTGQGQRVFVGHRNKKFYEDQFFFATPEIFSVFDFPLLRGDPRTALHAPHAIVLTEEMAQKYFPGQDPMGKTVLADPYNEGKLISFLVKGIAANVPANSHVHFDFLAAYDIEAEDADNFGAIYQNYTYVLLGNRREAADLQSKLRPFLLRHWVNPWYDLYLQPLLDIRLHSHLRSEIEVNGDVTYILVFSLIALFIMAIACINYTNLATARAIQRAKEVAIRRTIGASRPQLVRQFLGEALTVSFLSACLAVGLSLCVLPLFNRLAGKELAAASLLQPAIGLAALTLIIVLGLLAGLFPALFLSRLQPGNPWSRHPRSAGSVLRKILVTFQFSLSIVTVAGALVAVRQWEFIQNKNLGFDREGMMVVTLNDAVRANYDAFRAEMLAVPGVRSLAASDYVPTRGSMHWNFQFEGNSDPVGQVVYRIDKDFFSTYNLRLIAGRPIQRVIESPSGNEFMISESSVRSIGYESASAAIGKAVQIENVRGFIAGVVGDIHIYSLHQNPYPTIYFIRPIPDHKYLSLRLHPGNLSRTMQAVAAAWRKMVPDYPLDYFFLDQNFLRLHEGDANVSRLIGCFSILCIVVACLGLFGLGSFTIEQRTKEIALRKVLGAPLSGIVSRLCREFIQWVLLANVIAWPAAYLLIRRWLRDFAYRTRIPPGIFVLAGLLAFLIAWITIIVPTWRAARANPVDSLRYE
ncbi:MAG: ABC transporter permease [Candidatus Aminicenantes bacterium]|nr:ABC transporter permease [Candidatus Aminicenantes bacterium]